MVVAGGGIVGLCCAWRLAQAGVRVRLFEASRPASESSWAAAGMLAPGGEFTAPSPLAAAAVASLRQYPEFVRELVEESGMPVDHRVCGAVEIAFDDRQFTELRCRAEAQTAIGIASEACVHRCGGAPMDARFYPGDALVNPRHLTAALIRACLRRGVEIREQEPVLSIEEKGHAVRTAAGEYACDGVVVAAGAWSSALHSALPRSYPVRGHLIGWNSGDITAVPILRNAHTYVVRRADGAMVAGSSTERVGFERSVDDSVVRDIRRRVARVVPEAPLEQARAWVGFRPAVDEEEPCVKQIQGTQIFAAYGHYRNGILLAPETGRRIERLIASS